MINTVTLAMKFYRQPQIYTEALDVLNMIFTAVFALEFIFKLAAFRFKVEKSNETNHAITIDDLLSPIDQILAPLVLTDSQLQNYFGDAWNVFDFIIVLGSFIDIVYSEVNVRRSFRNSEPSLFQTGRPVNFPDFSSSSLAPPLSPSTSFDCFE